MATSNIDKALYPADGGLPDLMDMGEPALEIEIDNPDAVTLADGSMEITLEPGKEVSDEFSKNLAEDMDDSELGALASELMEYVDADINSRKDWTETYVKGLEVLGMKYEERTEP